MIETSARQQVKVHSLGLTAYAEALSYQQQLRDALIDRKRRNPELATDEGPTHHLIFCQHPPVYTLGKSGKIEHLLMSEDALADQGVSFYKAGRGGDITFHGPGQLVCYPIFDLDWFFTDVHRYVRCLEQAIIGLCADFGIAAFGLKSFTGVWLGEESDYRKICAIGVHLSRWVTMHGLALNVNTDLTYFDQMVPCGINDDDKSVTSIAKELNDTIDMNDIEQRLLDHLSRVFDFRAV